MFRGGEKMPTFEDLMMESAKRYHRWPGRSGGSCFGVSDPSELRHPFETLLLPGRKFSVGDRVVYSQKKSIHKGALRHGENCNATVIAAYGGDDSPQVPTYRLLLDATWQANSLSGEYMLGKKIIVGNIWESQLEALLTT